jgi:hypothetical protein
MLPPPGTPCAADVDISRPLVKMCKRETKMGKRKNQSIGYVQVETGEGMCWHEDARNVERGDSQSFNRIIHGDALTELAKYPADCVHLVLTSPPYADSRKQTYGGIHPDNYVQWFLPFADQFKRVLKPSGSFVLNIKEKARDGERHTYVLEIILEMRKRGWLWTEEYVWHKKNCYPGKWPNRFRDAWERCLQFK